VTPSRDKEPVFEVTGLPENVDTARKEIEAHIAMRTGGLMNPCDEANDFHTNGIDQTYPGSVGNELVSLYKSNMNGLNTLNSAFSAYCDNSNILNSTNNQDNIFTFPTITNNSKLSDFSISGFSNSFNLYDSVDEGISESPTFDPTVAPPTPSSLWPDFSSRSSSFGTCSTSTNSTGIGSLQRRSSSVSGPPMTPRLSPTLTDLDHPPARRIRSDPLTGITVLPSSSTAISGVTFVSNTVPSTTTSMLNGFSGVGNMKGSSSAAGSTSSSPTDSLGSAERKAKRDCVICFESDVVAALVPCGHNLFCLECANRVCDKSEPECPVCHQPVIQAIRIYS
jgi:RNA-binding protein MEX3